MLENINFCQICGQKIFLKEIDGRIRPCCTNCGYIVYLDPKVAVVVLISTDCKLVLICRATEPAIGCWSFPSGFVDRGEALEDAAVREVREETGLEVSLKDFVGVYSKTDDAVVVVVYTASVTGGNLRPGPEVCDVSLFSPDNLPAMPFPHDDQILSDWRSLEGIESTN
jgi:ADP-ribose pyrophosphatase YjhB (NUDIX family)